MTENAPPAAAIATAATGDGARGMPYYEKLRKDLRDALSRKRNLDQQLSNLEDDIFKMESSYLDDTGAGNIIKGFDNYMKGSATTTGGGMGSGTATRRKGGITEADRIFSRSSAIVNRDSPAPSATPSSHAATPTTSGAVTPGGPNSSKLSASIALTNKKKKAPDRDDDEEKPAKRGKISYGRD